MKKIFLLSLILAVSFLVTAQQNRVAVPALKNISKSRPAPDASVPGAHFLYRAPNPLVKSSLASVETLIGETRYDLQTNQACQNRLVRFPDGSMSAVWTFGMTDPNFADRGTGYNYFDGTAWGTVPSVRIESLRTGWPSVFALGQNGEGVISHDFATPGKLMLMKRVTKGSGTWNETAIPHSGGTVSLSWPRATSNGTGNNSIHLIALSRPVVSGGSLFQGMDGALLYSRSQDGGNTWDIANQILPGMSSAAYVGFGGDCYAWAEPKGNTIAFVVGDNWTDLFLMKSTDNGQNWTKTMIFQHPYPFFQEEHTLVLDTPYVSDGSLAILLDDAGKAHVFSGIMRVGNSDTTDQQTSYWPYTDGLLYWNEDMPAFSTLHFDSLWNQGHIVGYVQDINGNDTIMEFDGIGTYFLSLSTFPTACMDDHGTIFLAYTSVMENLSNGSQNYRHIWARTSLDGGLTWQDAKDITGSLQHNFHECVFPFFAARVDNNLHMVYQYDEEPGLAVRGDADPYGDNSISYLTLPKTDLSGLSVPENTDLPAIVSQNYPNPCKDNTFINLSLPKASNIKVSVLNLPGQSLLPEQNGFYAAGNHQLKIRVSDLQSGLYFYRITIGNHVITKPMIVE
ncbi:MAG TPA: T9SS type A sorting domain-containing protein [Bacteroidales bacterium]|nr:T9SS type A sorting domain-containing protein [Bacteroidales bacterium]HSA42822.1 T9SS type A sorting domain-containing protein [Bacteroidales bacterium]